MRLTEFLLARIGEDEDAIRSRWNAAGVTDEAFWGTPFQPSRVLGECESKRRIVALHESWPVLVEQQPEFETLPGAYDYTMRMYQQIAWLTTREYVARFGADPPTAPILSLLALPYADHPDYDPAWAL